MISRLTTHVDTSVVADNIEAWNPNTISEVDLEGYVSALLRTLLAPTPPSP